jgi:hypothetical protein
MVPMVTLTAHGATPESAQSGCFPSVFEGKTFFFLLELGRRHHNQLYYMIKNHQN